MNGFLLQSLYISILYLLHTSVIFENMTSNNLCNYIHLGSCLCYVPQQNNTFFKKAIFFSKLFIDMERRNENDSFFLSDMAGGIMCLSINFRYFVMVFFSGMCFYCSKNSITSYL